MTESTAQKPVALITGASSGIGLELGRVFAAEGHDLVLIARREDRLRELAREVQSKYQTRCTVIPVDLSKPSAGAAIAGHLESLKIAVDVLVNNAGYGTYGFFAANPLDSELQMIQVNVMALTELTKRLLPGMLKRGSGRILNVASTAAFQPGPMMAVYYATKAYVLSFTEALANEVKGTGVTITALCPGPTQSGFQAVAKMESSKLVKGKRMPDSASVARAGYRALMRGRRIYIPGIRNRLLAGSVRLAPRGMVTSFVRYIQERKEGNV